MKGYINTHIKSNTGGGKMHRLRKQNNKGKGYYFWMGDDEMRAINYLKWNNYNVSEVIRIGLKRYVNELKEKDNRG